MVIVALKVKTANAGGRGDGAGGAGGVSGASGAGGKVYSTELKVTPMEKFSVRIGLGGAGGSYAENGSIAGSLGTPTTFGTLSSNNGSSSEIGFVDPVNGKQYAKPGDAGKMEAQEVQAVRRSGIKKNGLVKTARTYWGISEAMALLAIAQVI